MITKTIKVDLTSEEINSTEDIEIVIEVSETNSDEKVVYTITYPKN